MVQERTLVESMTCGSHSQGVGEAVVPSDVSHAVRGALGHVLRPTFYCVVYTRSRVGSARDVRRITAWARAIRSISY